MHMKKFRNNGTKGALLDEYEKAIVELQKVIENVTSDELVAVVDHETTNQNCKSIQSIGTHVIRAGHNYARAVRKSLGERIEFADLEKLNSIKKNWATCLNTMKSFLMTTLT